MENTNILTKPKKQKKLSSLHKLNGQLIWWLMLLPGLALTLLFKYGSMFGVIIAFQDFGLGATGFFGNDWVGLDNFYYVFSLKAFGQSIVNTLLIASCKMVLGIIVPLTLALLINEVGKKRFAKVVQTTYFLPFFLSWIILGGIISQMFSYNGIINTLVSMFGHEKILFLLDNDWFRAIIIISDVWKGMGYNMVIFLAAIAGVDPSLYEAAEIDGANRLQRVWHVTLPGISPVVFLLSTLALSGILNANFDQVYILYNPMVYEGGDIIDTFIYRLGFTGDARMDVSSAVGLMKSLVSCVLVGGTYYFAYKKFGYRIF
jgi:putative aldouronate transport system permease protein